jgi:hypothetical protein
VEHPGPGGTSSAPNTPQVAGRAVAGGGGLAPRCEGGAYGSSANCGGDPTASRGAQPELGETRHVLCASQQVEIGIDFPPPPYPCSPAPVAVPHQMAELALDFGTGPAVVGSKLRVGAALPLAPDELLVGGDADGPARLGRGARLPEGAVGTGATEMGRARPALAEGYGAVLPAAQATVPAPRSMTPRRRRGPTVRRGAGEPSRPPAPRAARNVCPCPRTCPRRTRRGRACPVRGAAPGRWNSLATTSRRTGRCRRAGPLGARPARGSPPSPTEPGELHACKSPTATTGPRISGPVGYLLPLRTPPRGERAEQVPKRRGPKLVPRPVLQGSGQLAQRGVRPFVTTRKTPQP